MEILDISLGNIRIESPVSGDDDQYVFPLLYEDKELVIQTQQKYLLQKKGQFVELHIKDRNDLVFFSELYEYLKSTLYDCHDSWFENKYEKGKFDAMFKNYLCPNIRENAINIQCVVDASFVENMDENIEVIPTFRISCIVFDDVCFQIRVILENYKKI